MPGRAHTIARSHSKTRWWIHMNYHATWQPKKRTLPLKPGRNAYLSSFLWAIYVQYQLDLHLPTIYACVMPWNKNYQLDFSLSNITNCLAICVLCVDQSCLELNLGRLRTLSTTVLIDWNKICRLSNFALISTGWSIAAIGFASCDWLFLFFQICFE